MTRKKFNKIKKNHNWNVAWNSRFPLKVNQKLHSRFGDGPPNDYTQYWLASRTVAIPTVSFNSWSLRLHRAWVRCCGGWSAGSHSTGGGGRLFEGGAWGVFWAFAPTHLSHLLTERWPPSPFSPPSSYRLSMYLKYAQFLLGNDVGSSKPKYNLCRRFEKKFQKKLCFYSLKVI